MTKRPVFGDPESIERRDAPPIRRIRLSEPQERVLWDMAHPDGLHAELGWPVSRYSGPTMDVLERHGLVERDMEAGRYGKGEYILTELGRQMVPELEPPIARPDGKEYTNTERDWNYLQKSSTYARWLGLVAIEDFEDRRVGGPLEYAVWLSEDEKTGPELTESASWQLLYDLFRDYSPAKPETVSLDYMPRLETAGYDQAEQGYLVEVWIEKTTMNDVLEPVCRLRRTNLFAGAGEMSITQVEHFMRRVREAKRPGRILYVSDFDPGGYDMPISVARKIEWLHRKGGYEDLDICLEPIVLTCVMLISPAPAD